jgi:WD40 repeat protein
VVDSSACTTTQNGIETLTVTISSDTGDSEQITLYEVSPGSSVFINRINDLVTTAGSKIVTSASSTFITDGVQPGDIFAIATGPDTGTYTVESVDSENQITLTTTLSSSETGIGFNADPLMTATGSAKYTTYCHLYRL